MEKNLQSGSTASPLLKSLLVKAGAGAGKTTHLIERLVWVSESYFKTFKAWPRIIVTTFTNKATEELKERLMKKCIYEKEFLLDFITSSKNLHISTLHGVLSLFLKKYGGFLEDTQKVMRTSGESKGKKELSYNFEVVQSVKMNSIFRSILKDLLFKDEKSHALLQDFEFERLLSVLLSWHSAFLENPSLKPQDKEGFLKLFEMKLESWVECLKALLVKNQKHNESVSEGGNKEKMDHSFSNFLKEINLSLNKESFRLSNWPLYFHQFRLIENLAKKFHIKLMEYKLKFREFEIKDLELFSLKLIKEKEDTAKAFSKEWDYWLIDEYQDTSPLQDKILKALIKNQPSFIVGDPQQSIYLFRGASASLFQEREEKEREKGGDVLLKTKNYRSRPELLFFLNDFFQSVSSVFHFTAMEAKTEKFDPNEVVCTFSISEECLEENKVKEHYEFLSLSENIRSLIQKGAKYKDIGILARTHESLNKLSQVLRQQRIPYITYGNSRFNKRREILDIKALLKFLIHPHDNLNLIQLLRSPYFYLSDESILNTINSINHVKNGEKDSYWEKFLNNPKQKGPILKLQTYANLAQVEGIVQGLRKAIIDSHFVESLSFYDSSGKAEANLWKWMTQLEKEEKKKGFRPLQFIEEGPLKEGGDQFSFYDEEKEDVFEEDALWVKESVSQSEAPSPLEPDQVSLLTVHASKGLGFKYVFLFDMHKKVIKNSEAYHFFTLDASSKWSTPLYLGEGLEKEKKWIPSISDEDFIGQKKKKEEKESERLLYVALTRAKSSLFLSWVEPKTNRTSSSCSPSSSSVSSSSSISTSSSTFSSWASKIKKRWNLKETLNRTEKYSYVVKRK